MKESMLRPGQELTLAAGRQSDPGPAPPLVLSPGKSGVSHGDPAQDDPELICAQARLESPRQH